MWWGKGSRILSAVYRGNRAGGSACGRTRWAGKAGPGVSRQRVVRAAQVRRMSGALRMGDAGGRGHRSGLVGLCRGCEPIEPRPRDGLWGGNRCELHMSVRKSECVQCGYVWVGGCESGCGCVRVCVGEGKQQGGRALFAGRPSVQGRLFRRLARAGQGMKPRGRFRGESAAYA